MSSLTYAHIFSVDGGSEKTPMKVEINKALFKIQFGNKISVLLHDILKLRNHANANGWEIGLINKNFIKHSKISSK